MGRITDCRVTYSETRKITEYEPRRAEVVFGVAFDDGDDYDKVFAQIRERAKHEVQVMLGLTKAEAPKHEKPAKATPAEESEVDEPAEPPAPKKRGPKKVAKAPEPELPIEESADEPAEEAEDDPLADLEEEPVVAISDADLTKAIAKAKERLGEDGGVQIRKLILKFAPKIPQIPADKREMFLEGLKALK